MRWLFDGWTLVHAPCSPAGLHLLALIEHLPEVVDGVLALPAPAPEWLVAWAGELTRPPGMLVNRPTISDTGLGRLAWEQRILPKLAVEHHVQGLQTCGGSAPLVSKIPVTFSSAMFAELQPLRGFVARLSRAMGEGGASQARLLWPGDMPVSLAPSHSSIALIPPFTSRLFCPMKTDASNHSMLEAHLELPENYVLYHGSGVEAALHRLLSAWSWVAGPVGEVYPLLVVGLEVGSRQRLEHLAHQYGVGESVRAITPFSPTESALLYQRCTALFHPELPAAWGDPLLHALACGKPIVGIESPGSDQRLGPAAYLAPADDSRAQGAALLSVLVEDVIREQLSAAAGQRRLAWEDPGASLGALWKSV